MNKNAYNLSQDYFFSKKPPLTAKEFASIAV